MFICSDVMGLSCEVISLGVEESGSGDYVCVTWSPYGNDSYGDELLYTVYALFDIVFWT
jgi:hypothetical protein